MPNPSNPRTRRSREAERLQAQQEARELALRKAQRKRQLIGVGVVVVVVLATIGGVFAATREKSSTSASPTTTSKAPPSSTSSVPTNPGPPAVLPVVAPGETITGETPCPAADGSSPRVTRFEQAPPMCIDPAGEYEATIHTTKGDIQMFVQPQAAPQTVNNFVTLARYHYYDGLPITRIIPRGWAEIDDITDADGNRGPGYRLANESDSRGTVATPNTIAMVPDPDGTTGGAFLFGLADQYAGMPANVVPIGVVSDNRLDQSPGGALDRTVAQEVDKAATESHRPAEVITITGIEVRQCPCGPQT